MKNKNIFIDIEGKELETFDCSDIEITQAFVRVKEKKGKEIFIPWHRIKSIEITETTGSNFRGQNEIKI